MRTKLELMEDALDHIARVARNAIQPTRRLDWIAARAKIALRGDEYDSREMPQRPKRQKHVEMDGLRTERDKLLDALERLVSSLEGGSPECIGQATDHARSVITRSNGDQTITGTTDSAPSAC